MTRPILAIAIEAAEREGTAPAPARLFGTNDRVAKILRGAAKDTTREILRRTRYRGLSEFHSQWAFMTEPGRYAYSMPPDFLRMIPDAEIRNGWPLGLVGPASPQSWARWIAGMGSVSAPMGWRIKNNALFIDPTPMGSELLVIEYISRYPVVRNIGPEDLDLATIPATVIAPYVPRDGYIATGISIDGGAQLDAFVFDEDPGFDVGTWAGEPAEISEYLKRLNPLSAVAPLAQLRQEEFEADTDLSAFEDDYLLSLGMTFRLRRGLTMPYAEAAAEYEREMEVKLAEDAGGARDFTFGNCETTVGAVPLGGGNWMIS